MPENKIFGYARVSSRDQNEARQRKELLDYGINERDIFVDKLSGKNFNRDQYQALRNHMLRKGDVLVIKSIDRFGRNYREILDEWKYIVEEIGADIVVLDMPLLDTRKNKDLLGTLISDIVLTLLSYVAENEREAIRQRQKEGIAIARSKGVSLAEAKTHSRQPGRICTENGRPEKFRRSRVTPSSGSPNRRSMIWSSGTRSKNRLDDSF